MAKAALVVGAGDATGGAIARAFAAEGYTVCVNRRARNVDALEALAQSIRDAWNLAAAYPGDARDEGEMVAMIEAVERDVGPIEVAAQHLDCFMPYVDAVMAAMWEHGAALGDEAVVRETLIKAGLDTHALLALCNDAEVKAELSANTDAAAKRGAFGVPTFFVGDEMFWGKERLGQVEAALAG